MYLLETPPQDPLAEVRCLLCQNDLAVCEGGDRVGPRPGVWRNSAMSPTFMRCPRFESCLGMANQDESVVLGGGSRPTGWCAEGYYGAFCSGCLPRYSRAGDAFLCRRCADNVWLDLARIVGNFLLVLAMIVVLVQSTLSSAGELQTHAVFVKILLNHMQMIIVAMTFDIEWPAFIATFLNNLSKLAELVTAVISFDCWVDPRSRDPGAWDAYRAGWETDPESEFRPYEGELRLTYVTLLLWVAIPIACCLASFGIWQSIGLYYRGGPSADSALQTYTKFLSTLIILLFVTHPLISQYLIQMFDCRRYDGDLRLEIDLQVLCWQDDHLVYAGIALAFFVLWGLGLPALIYCLMAKEERLLETDGVKVQFGFLYLGYRREVYFWEIVIMYRKLIALVVAVLLKPLGTIVQGTLLVVFLGVNAQVNSMMRPYATRQLNDTEDLSLLAQVATIYCGLFFEQVGPAPKGGDESAVQTFEMRTAALTRLFLFAAILCANLIFVVTWLLNFLQAARDAARAKSEALYVCLFLCCRRDKLEADAINLAQERKREDIIQKIDEVQFYMKNVKDFYSKQIFYEGHEKFIELLYHIEGERSGIDLRAKEHNLYVRGAITRERKLDLETLALQKEDLRLDVDADKGGYMLEMAALRNLDLGGAERGKGRQFSSAKKQ
jgi:hypothetical protein